MLWWQKMGKIVNRVKLTIPSQSQPHFGEKDRKTSTMMLPGSRCLEVNEGSQLPSELVTDVEAQDTSGLRLLGSMTNAVNCMSSAVGAVKATIARRWPHE